MDRHVFPAQAGVFLSLPSKSSPGCGLPRASGGVSTTGLCDLPCPLSSPRKRGCFQVEALEGCLDLVFPAQAGVFPAARTVCRLRSRLPRASGGVSGFKTRNEVRQLSSPRKRGCFRSCHGRRRWRLVFPAQAGVFPFGPVSLHTSGSLPRASGGVSDHLPSFLRIGPSSPRKRGCFHLARNLGFCESVFPAQAGVFPSPLDHSESALGLPRASGGVSVYSVFDAKRAASSPRKRGCFWHR